MVAGPKWASPGGLDRRSPPAIAFGLEWLSLLITRVAKSTTFWKFI